MSSAAVALILISAFLHAGWNLAAKRTVPTAALFLAANSIGAWIFFPWVIAYPDVVINMPYKVWILLIISGSFQALYLISLAAAYRHGDLSTSYPLSRSLPVIIVPVVTIIIGRGDLLGSLFMIGALLVLVGGILVSLNDLKRLRFGAVSRNALPAAFLAAVGTTGYSMLDDQALRIIRNSFGTLYGTVPVTFIYTFLEAITCAAWIGAFLLMGGERSRDKPVQLRWAAGAGALMYLTYALVLVSMAYARDVSLIVAFRQVSILAGALMGFIFLKEPAIRSRVLGLAVLLAGLTIVAIS